MMNKDILNKLDHTCNHLAAFHSNCKSMTSLTLMTSMTADLSEGYYSLFNEDWDGAV